MSKLPPLVAAVLREATAKTQFKAANAREMQRRAARARHENYLEYCEWKEARRVQLAREIQAANPG
jgi:hypothetical protein